MPLGPKKTANNLLIVSPPNALKTTALNDHDELLKNCDYNFTLFDAKIILFDILLPEILRLPNVF